MAIASIKSKGGWKDQTRFCLGISMGHNHQSESLEAIVAWINQSPFESGIIDLSDTLNRYNFMRDGVTEDKAAQRALQQGDDWLLQNESILEKLSKPVEIIRWNAWLKNPDYADVHAKVVRAYQENLAFQHAVLQDIKTFLSRKGEDATGKDYALCRAYLIEEIACHSLLYNSSDMAAIYPGKQLESYRVIRAGAVPGIAADLTHSPFVRLVVHSFDKPVAKAGIAPAHAAL